MSMEAKASAMIIGALPFIVGGLVVHGQPGLHLAALDDQGRSDRPRCLLCGIMDASAS